MRALHLHTLANHFRSRAAVAPQATAAQRDLTAVADYWEGKAKDAESEPRRLQNE